MATCVAGLVEFVSQNVVAEIEHFQNLSETMQAHCSLLLTGSLRYAQSLKYPDDATAFFFMIWHRYIRELNNKRLAADLREYVHRNHSASMLRHLASKQLPALVQQFWLGDNEPSALERLPKDDAFAVLRMFPSGYFVTMPSHLLSALPPDLQWQHWKAFGADRLMSHLSPGLQVQCIQRCWEHLSRPQDGSSQDDDSLSVQSVSLALAKQLLRRTTALAATHPNKISPPLVAAFNRFFSSQLGLKLLAETTNIVPGETTWLGLRLDPAEHWHTYWKMGGDSGEPTSLNEWSAPEGSQIGEIQWPAPHWLPFYDTDLVNFGYEEETLHPIAVTIPADYEGESVEISTLAYWNVCDQICIPGEQRLSITLPVSDVAELDAGVSELFADARSKLPETDHSIQSLIAIAGERVSLGFEAQEAIFADYSDAWFFPEERRVIKPGPLRDVSLQGNLLQITHQQPRRMQEDPQVFGTLVLETENGQRRAFDFVNPAADANSTTIMPLAAVSAEEAGSSSGGGSAIEGNLLLYMAFAMLGGLILNLMPCVFPVLSIKAISIAKNVGETKAKQRMDGLVYTAGVVVAFVVLASALIALRAGGEAVGWAFQFQQPWFLAFIVYLFFLMALSLSGVFEIGTSLMGAGSSLTNRSGYQGSFFTGVLATTVATPCTAPFMGPAIGFALTQSWLVAMLVFISLGVGMALPILLLSFAPALNRYMPKPGAWMETFKQLMAFPLYASALFFLWVLGTQVGVMGMALVLGVCVLMAFAAWIHQRRFTMGPIYRSFNAATIAAVFALSIYLTQTPFLQTQASPRVASGGNVAEAASEFEPFSTARLESLQAEGRPVFINMTAAWCITCLANEQTTLSTDRVKQAMADNGITYLKGDWTNEDPEITAMLEKFNRPSVPLYVLYSGDGSVEPVILPQILTPGIVTEAFNNI